MGILRFSDGWKVNTDGEYRAVHGPDGWYVVGHGVLYAVDSYPEAVAEAKRLKALDAKQSGKD